jgi:uncharacterized protein (TIGR03663 family)
VALALAAGATLRFGRLDRRPMHHDEANQAVKFGALLERGEYRYDAFDHHGPTLYYLTLPAATLRGQATLASLDEWTLRGVTAAFGAVTILLLPLLTNGIGRAASVAGAWLLALSPAMVFYSRMFIQESLLACFTLAFMIAAGRVAMHGGTGWAIVAGVAAGLAASTKETAAIVLPAVVLACVAAGWSVKGVWPAGAFAAGRSRAAVGAALLSAAAVYVVFYSSFFSAPSDVLAPFRAAGTYLGRGIAPADHVHPWHYYLRLLAYSSDGGLRWSEGLILALASVGAVVAWAAPDRSQPERTFWARYLTIYVVLAATIFSAIRYKTPWNLLPFHVGAIVLAGVGLSALIAAAASRAVRVALVGVVALGAGHLGWQAWRASVTYAADPRNPYVYAQTVPDAVRMAARIRNLAALHPDGSRMLVAVIASPHEQWPLPWYLRTMPHVGYWTTPADAAAIGAPVVVAAMEHTAAVDAAVGGRYVSEFFGLRPEVLLALYIERGLWDRFLAKAGSAARCGPHARCGTVAGDECVVTPPELALVVPCYNEAARLDPPAFLDFAASRPGVRLVMVDDGSSDGTGDVLERIRAAAPSAVTIVRHAPRRGKAEAVRAGMLEALRQRAALAGFFDADLSTPLGAVDDFLAVLRDRPQVEFVLGSRVMLMGRDIERKASRHYLGRLFATAASHALDLPVYDTQCGAKILRVNAATATMFAAPFRSPWIFDVELIARYLRLPPGPAEPPRRDRLYELVLPAWHDVAGSKLHWYDFARAMVDLGYIWRERIAALPAEASAKAGPVTIQPPRGGDLA